MGSNIKNLNMLKTISCLSLLPLFLSGCNPVTQAQSNPEENYKIGNEVVNIQVRELPKNWKGESTCKKGNQTREYAVFSTLAPTDTSTFDFTVKIPGLDGSSTINFELKGRKVVGYSPNGTKFTGEFSNNFSSISYSAPPRSKDGLQCFVNMIES